MDFMQIRKDSGKFNHIDILSYQNASSYDQICSAFGDIMGKLTALS